MYIFPPRPISDPSQTLNQSSQAQNLALSGPKSAISSSKLALSSPKQPKTFIISPCSPSISYRSLRGRCPTHVIPTYTDLRALGTADHLTLLRYCAFECFELYAPAQMPQRLLLLCIWPCFLWESSTVCLFSNETKDDGINPKQIEIIKFQKKFLKEYVLAFICAKS